MLQILQLHPYLMDQLSQMVLSGLIIRYVYKFICMTATTIFLKPHALN